MADGVNIDWSLLKQPDPVASYQNAFQAGRQIAAQGIASSAMAGFAANPAAPVDPRLAAADPGAYAQVRAWRQAAGQASPGPPPAGQIGGDSQGAAQATSAQGAPQDATLIQDRIAGMTDAQRAAASQAQEQFAAILNGLKMQTTDPNQRLAMAQHFAGLHPEFGINPAAITPDDVSDQGIAGHIAAAMSLKDQLDRANGQGQTGGAGYQPASRTPAGGGYGADAPAGVGEAWERAAFYQRAAGLGMPARAIDALWARYAALHHPMAAPAAMASPPLSTGQAMSDQDLIAALRLHGVPGFAPQARAAPPEGAPATGATAHTLSDQDLTSLLEF